MKDLNKNLDQYVLENNYFEDQKKKQVQINILVNSNQENLKFLDCIGLKRNQKLDTLKKWKRLKNG